jgi:hypothetical protein
MLQSTPKEPVSPHFGENRTGAQAKKKGIGEEQLQTLVEP